MYIRIFIIIIFLSFPGFLIAQKEALKIQLVNNSKLELSPGKSINIVIKLFNNSDSKKVIQLKIESPTGWNQLSDYNTIKIKKKSRRLKILSFHIPKSTASGNYKLKITAINKTSTKQINTVAIPVFIKPRYEIIAQVLEGPEFVLAGNMARVKYMIKNTSNSVINISASIPKGFSDDKLKAKLMPDSLMFIEAKMVTEKQISYLARNNLSIHLSVKEKPEINKIVPHIFNIIPSQKTEFDKYNRFPVKVSLLTVAHQKRKEWNYGGMYNITGSGSLSQGSNHFLNFHVRGPNRKGNPLFAQNDLYFAEYSSPRSKVKVGDNNYGLSYLSESSRNGRGIMYEHNFGALSAGGFANYPRYYPRIKWLYALYGKYDFTKNAKLNIGYLNKMYREDSIASVYTLSGKAKPFSWLSIEGEYAIGNSEKTTSAYKSLVYLKYKSIRGFINYTKAMKDFPGYLSNSKFLTLALSTIVLKKADLSLRYNLNNTNLALDTLYANAPQSKNINFSGNYNFTRDHSIGYALYERSREDKMTPKLFHYKERFARLSLDNKFNDLRIKLSGEIGKMDNLLNKSEGEISNVLNGKLYLRYQFNDQLEFNGFLNYRGGQKYLSDDFKMYYYGGAFKTVFPDIIFYLRYRNDYTPDEYYKDRSILAFSSNISPGKNHDVGMSINYNLQKNSLNSTTIYANLNYSYKINMPLAKKANTGSLKGRIVNNGVSSVEGIICSLAGNTAITDKEGLFEFPVIKKGTYYLLLDYSNVGIYAIPEISGPYKVNIIPGEINHFDISLTKAGIIKGKIIISEDEHKNKPGYIPTSEKLGDLIIEAQRGQQVFRKYTTNKGDFSFDNLVPGKWTIKVFKQGIPSGYELMKSKFEVNLEKGETEFIEVSIKKYSRKIKFQKNTQRP